MARVLLTGLTGFIGSHLARSLVADGAEVHAVVRPGARLERVADVAARVTVHEDDGTATTLQAIVERADPAIAYHLATNFLGAHAADDVGPLVIDNVAFPARIAEALAGPTALPFVNVGTAWQHVGGAPYRPKNLYAATKQAFEDVLRHYSDRGLLHTVTLNLYDTYGPLDHRGKLLATLIERLRTGEPLPMSSGTQLIDLVHVDDVVAALRLAGEGATARTLPSGAVYAASGGERRSVRDVVDVLGRVAVAPVPVEWGVRPDRDDEMVEHWDAGPPVPGWQPRVTLDEGLAALLAPPFSRQ
jgi:nucleoside-diphosphate-sugar epimerase